MRISFLFVSFLCAERNVYSNSKNEGILIKKRNNEVFIHNPLFKKNYHSYKDLVIKGHYNGTHKYNLVLANSGSKKILQTITHELNKIFIDLSQSIFIKEDLFNQIIENAYKTYLSFDDLIKMDYDSSHYLLGSYYNINMPRILTMDTLNQLMACSDTPHYNYSNGTLLPLSETNKIKFVEPISFLSNITASFTDYFNIQLNLTNKTVYPDIIKIGENLLEATQSVKLFKGLVFQMRNETFELIQNLEISNFDPFEVDFSQTQFEQGIKVVNDLVYFSNPLFLNLTKNPLKLSYRFVETLIKENSRKFKSFNGDWLYKTYVGYKSKTFFVRKTNVEFNINKPLKLTDFVFQSNQRFKLIKKSEITLMDSNHNYYNAEKNQIELSSKEENLDYKTRLSENVEFFLMGRVSVHYSDDKAYAYVPGKIIVSELPIYELNLSKTLKYKSIPKKNIHLVKDAEFKDVPPFVFSNLPQSQILQLTALQLSVLNTIQLKAFSQNPNLDFHDEQLRFLTPTQFYQLVRSISKKNFRLKSAFNDFKKVDECKYGVLNQFLRLENPK